MRPCPRVLDVADVELFPRFNIVYSVDDSPQLAIFDRTAVYNIRCARMIQATTDRIDVAVAKLINCPNRIDLSRSG